MRRSLAILAVSALVVAGCSDSGDEPSDLGEAETTTTLPAWNPQPGQLPFEEPQQIPAQAGNVAVTLDVKAQTIMVSGQPLAATPFEATPAGGTKLVPKIDGPTIHVSPGGTITVTFVNDLTNDTNIHYHGLHVSPLDKSDNVFRTFAPKTTHESVVNLPANHPAGTYWYHVHYHGDTQLQVNGGLSGMLIVDGVEAALPPELPGDPAAPAGVAGGLHRRRRRPPDEPVRDDHHPAGERHPHAERGDWVRTSPSCGAWPPSAPTRPTTCS